MSDDLIQTARDMAVALRNRSVIDHPTSALLVSLADEVVRLREALAQYHAQDALFSAIADIANSDVDLEALDSALAGAQGDYHE